MSRAKQHVIEYLGSRPAVHPRLSRLRAEGIDANHLQVDRTVPETIRAAALRIEMEYGRLDVLINNAGIVDRGDGLPGHATLDSIRRTFETNVFGTLAVTQAMLPLLRKSTAARIVNVSSGLGSLTFNSDPDWEFSQVKFFGYSGSKATLDMMTVQLAAELAGDGIEVNAADPVFTANDLNQYRGYQTVEQGAEIVTRLALLGDNGPTGGFYCAGGANPW